MEKDLTLLPRVAFGLARLAGQAVLYGAEIAFPPSPSVETRAASITIYPARPPEPDRRAA